MIRSKGENLRSIYVLLFLNIAFFILEYEDPAKFAALFSFDRAHVFHGELWRLFTYQFSQAGQGWFHIAKPVILFLNLFLLYLLGSTMEEEWGTKHFGALFAVSTLTTAAVGAWLGVPLLGSYFINFTLLFTYATAFPDQVFYLLNTVPVRVRWIAWIAVSLLALGVFAGATVNLAPLAGVAAAYGYWLLNRAPELPPAKVPGERISGGDASAMRNAARYAAMKKALAASSTPDVDRLIAQSEREVVRGVNVCLAVDYKPEHTDGYCIRCDGFNECAARFLRLNRPSAAPPPDVPAVPEPTA